jgi:hypothetical protein
LKYLFLFIASAIILTATATAFPDLLLNPGPLMKGHQAFKNECLSCHKPFNGAVSLQCISCHKQSLIGIKTVAGVPLPKQSSKVLFHKGVTSRSCINCHNDHKGTETAKTVKPFMHAALSSALQKECINCHKNQKPEDGLHRSATENCSTCHTRTQWKPATFDHNQLTASNGKECITCHKADQPIDNLHPLPKVDCATCHTSTAWKPATYDHSKYFRLDGDHLAACSTCHTEPNNFKKYTCYNCHEHSPSKIADEHLEEGIYNYQNCIKCHRNGSEGEREGGYGGDRENEGGDDD